MKCFLFLNFLFSNFFLSLRKKNNQKFQLKKGKKNFFSRFLYFLFADAELRFRCSVCWKGFKHPMSLTLHKDLHTGKTKCPVCARSFSRSYDMRIHLNKIHKIKLKLDAKLNIKNIDNVTTK